MKIIVIKTAYVIYFHTDSLIFRQKNQDDFVSNVFRKIKKIVRNENFYCTRVNLRLNPKFVLEVGNVCATNGLFIVWSAKI